MEILIYLSILLAIVTVVGHVIWITIAALFRTLSGNESNATQHASIGNRPVLREDLAAMRRLIQYLQRAGISDADQIQQLNLLIEKTEQHQRLATAKQLQQELSGNSTRSSAARPAPLPIPTPQLRSRASENVPSNVSSNVPSSEPVGEPIVASLVPEPPLHTSARSIPKRATSEVLQSFLAAHNIRWGELTAGILIVVCSIGLVISLWSTLTETNRLIPASLFLAAVAAIEGAGLYTLRRWKLRETSRAVLMIATMLIPLSMMAGISVAGSGTQTVSLSDPMIWAAIGGGWVICLALIHFAGQALVGKPLRRMWLAAIGVPTLLLPLVPGISRTVGEQSIWLLVGAALLTTIWFNLDARRLQLKAGRSLLPARYQQWILFHAMSLYALIMLAVMLFLRLGRSMDIVVPAIIAAIPVMVAIAGAALVLRKRGLSGGRRLTVTSLGLSSILISIAAFPLMMQDFQWLLLWGVVLSASSIAIGLRLRTQDLLAIAPLALAIVAGPASSVWIESHAWVTDWPLWLRYVSGWSAISTLALGLGTFIFVKKPDTISGKETFFSWNPLLHVGALLMVVGVALAAAVGLGPESWLGMLPRFSMTLVLACVAMFAAIRYRTMDWTPAVTALLIWFAWASQLFTYDVWYKTPVNEWLSSLVMVLLGTAGTITILAELLKVVMLRGGQQRSLVKFSAYWSSTANAIAVLAAVLAIFSYKFDPRFAFFGVLVATGIIFFSAIRGRVKAWIWVSQIAVLGSLLISVLYIRPEWLDTTLAWKTWQAPHAVLISLVGLAIGWSLIRFLAARQTLFPLAMVRKDRVRLDEVLGTVALLAFAAFSGIRVLQWFYIYADGDSFQPLIPTQLFAMTTVGLVALAIVARVTKWRKAIPLSVPLLGLALTVAAGMQWSDLALSRIGFTTATSASAITMTVWLAVAATFVLVICIRKLDLLTTIVLTITTTCVAAAAMLAMHVGPDSIEFASQNPNRWIAVSMFAWPLLASVGIGSFAIKARNRELGYFAAMIPVLAAPILLYRFDGQAVWHEVVLAVGAASFMGVFAMACHRRTRKFLEIPIHVSVMGGAIAVVSVVVWTAAGIVNASSSAMADAVGPPDRWLLFMIATTTAVILGQWLSVGLSKQRQISELILVSAAGILAHCFAYHHWIAPQAVSITLAAIWATVAVVFGTEAFLRRTSGHHQTRMAIWLSLVSVVVVICWINVSANDVVTRPWAIGLWLVVGIWVSTMGTLTHRFLKQSGAGQGIGILGGLMLTLLMIRWIDDLEVLLATLAALYAGLALLWSLVNERAWIASALGTATVVCSLPVLSTVAEAQGFSIESLTTQLGLLVIVSLLVVVSTLAFAPRRFASLAIAFVATQLVAAFVVAFIEHRQVVVQSSCLFAIAAVMVAGLWTWAWPLMRSKFRDLASSFENQLRWMILLTAGCLLLGAIGIVFAGSDQTSKSLMIASVMGIGLIVGANARTKELDAIAASWMSLWLPTISVAVIGSGFILAAVGLRTEPGPVEVVVAMRLFLVSVIFTPSMIWLGRWIFGLKSEAWRTALSRGTIWGLGLAVLSMFAMYSVEFSNWGETEMLKIPLALVLGIMLLLGLTSLVATICGIFPNSVRPLFGELSDSNRTLIIYAAQVFGGLTWLHLYFCRPQLAIFGLRPYWPYTVMVLAFASAAITQFGHRRKDEVLIGTMRRSTLFLPLIPIIGFWIARRGEGWMFVDGRASYSALLILAAIFYGGLSFLWKQNRIPRIAGLILGNAALWVLLVQSPNLSFVDHPQLWLIPPAVCLIIATYLERDWVQSTLLTSVRYAATLVIYASSTADIMIGEIGATLWGPMVLITLALVGMLMGVVLRTRAFLYLGSLFVFIGVLSMVYHAGRAIDQSWPWWVFGITMGLMILGGLMYLEKNRAGLKRFANELAQWQA